MSEAEKRQEVLAQEQAKEIEQKKIAAAAKE
jgi:hypothetical protein